MHFIIAITLYSKHPISWVDIMSPANHNRKNCNIFVITCFRGNWIHTHIRASIKTTHLLSNAIVVVETRIVALFRHLNDVWRRAGLLVQRSLLDVVLLTKWKIAHIKSRFSKEKINCYQFFWRFNYGGQTFITRWMVQITLISSSGLYWKWP